MVNEIAGNGTLGKIEEDGVPFEPLDDDGLVMTLLSVPRLKLLLLLLLLLLLVLGPGAIGVVCGGIPNNNINLQIV